MTDFIRDYVYGYIEFFVNFQFPTVQRYVTRTIYLFPDP
jgi:hypothetical protein